jgi:hypothetical protein
MQESASGSPPLTCLQGAPPAWTIDPQTETTCSGGHSHGATQQLSVESDDSRAEPHHEEDGGKHEGALVLGGGHAQEAAAR